MNFTMRELAALIDALRAAEEYKRAILSSEFPPLPRSKWDPDDRQNAKLLDQEVARYRALRLKLQRKERPA